MRLSRLIPTLAAAAALSGLAPAAAMAQDPAAGGDYRAALTRMITSTADGTCPADVMGAELLAACTEQLPQMSAGLQSLGPIASMRFVRAEGEGAQRVEIYAVEFAGGVTLNWGIGGFHDGKFDVAYAGR